MRTFFLILLAAVGIGMIELSFFSALPLPWRLIPWMFILGVWLYQQQQRSYGLFVVMAWGIWHDLLGTHPWVPLTIIALVMVVTMVYISRRVFQHRSLYGLLGFSAVLVLVWTLTEAFFRFFSRAPFHEAFQGFWLGQLSILLFTLAILAGLFYSQFRFTKRR